MIDTLAHGNMDKLQSVCDDEETLDRYCDVSSDN